MTTTATTATVPVYDDPFTGARVFVCDHCGQPLRGSRDTCNSGIHVGPDGTNVGHAIASTELAVIAHAALAALGRC